MRLEIDIAEHHYNNIMALDSVSLGRVPYKGIIMYSINAIKHGKVLEQKTVTTKQLEEMYEKYQKKLWREHEDVRGDDMIEVGYAEEFLQELLLEFGCWDSEERE